MILKASLRIYLNLLCKFSSKIKREAFCLSSLFFKLKSEFDEYIYFKKR